MPRPPDPVRRFLTVLTVLAALGVATMLLFGGSSVCGHDHDHSPEATPASVTTAFHNSPAGGDPSTKEVLNVEFQVSQK